MATAVATHRALRIFDRPAMKKRNVSSPAYTEQQAAYRETFARTLSDALSEHGHELGCFITPNNDGDRNLVALTLTIPGFTFVTPDGTEMSTNQVVLNLSAVIAKDQGTPEVVEEPEAMTWDALQARTAQRKAEKKAAK